MKFYGFELPAPFSKFLGGISAPPKVGSIEARPVSHAISSPRISFYDPASLKFAETMKPIVPGNGGYITAGIDMVKYDHQPQWDRNAPIAGPVREFFHHVMFDNRVKHTG